ncbi:HAD family hydrolase [Streptomyces albipurpureus]|uniref:HAD hydrolase-like protein n=1 Tax=Streptomyces albipurpureus TaxID=2897419 RepID=A0ABT0V0A0_9ACTN|nr:HAD family hydrolase [Streptomyces sp. CWNU-1]MCM2394257.1 HAD hydrolase-like protein [Streptomyces sp. CWNU-1]
MTGSPSAAATDLFAAAKCVLFDFDGPICRLFAHHPAPVVAAGLRDWVERRVPGGVPVEQGDEGDPLALLRAVADRHPDGPLVQELERRLTEQELRAALTAQPTEGANALIRGLHEAGFRLAVTTNNAPDAARRYLARVGLSEYFGGHVHGRVPRGPQLMKPDPHCLRSALATTGSTSQESLMIGDSVADGEAAARLGVSFLGYARDEARRERLHRAGAVVVVSSMVELLPLLDGLEPGLPWDGQPSSTNSL